MSRKNKTIAGSIVTLLVFLLIAFVRSSLFDARMGADGETQEVVLAEATPEATEKPKETAAPKETEKPKETETTLKFRSKKLLNQHYEKHGIEMGFTSAQEYEEAAAAVVANPDALHKTEKEDGDDVYYLESTNEFVIVSTDGYLRTYFLPSGGINYYNKQ